MGDSARGNMADRTRTNTMAEIRDRYNRMVAMLNMLRVVGGVSVMAITRGRIEGHQEGTTAAATTEVEASTIRMDMAGVKLTFVLNTWIAHGSALLRS